MKALAMFGGAGAATAAIAGGHAGLVVGNLAMLAAAAALFISTCNLEKTRR
jgi:hypothetical protein